MSRKQAVLWCVVLLPSMRLIEASDLVACGACETPHNCRYYFWWHQRKTNYNAVEHFCILSLLQFEPQLDLFAISRSLSRCHFGLSGLPTIIRHHVTSRASRDWSNESPAVDYFRFFVCPEIPPTSSSTTRRPSGVAKNKVGTCCTRTINGFIFSCNEQ